MKNKFVKNSGWIFVAVLCFVLGVYYGAYTEAQIVDEPITIEKEIIVNPSLWDCKLVKTCEPADWIGIDGNGRARPEDHCEYEYKIVQSFENPAINSGYGSYCEIYNE